VFADLDKLRLINTAFNERISANPAFLQLLACERLRALERLTWTEGGTCNQRKLPKSFSLQFASPKDDGSSSSSSSTTTVSSARFHIHKQHQSPQFLEVEAKHNDSTPEQVRTPPWE
jgi:hypothetical protein